MYVFLWVLGAATSVAGIALVASGVSLQDHVFDTATITPGLVAFIGGLVLIGLGLAVKILKRIERSLAERPMPRTARPDTAAVEERANQPARIPFPPKPKVERQPQPAPVGAVLAAPPGEPVHEQTREEVLVPAPVETATVAEASAAAVLPRLPVRAEAEAAPAVNGHAPGRLNGGTPAKAAPRLDANARAAKAPIRDTKTAVFESLWPKGPRVGQAPPQAPGSAAVPAAALVEPEPRVEPQLASVVGQPQPPQPAPPPVVSPTPVPISVLKSGVVDGMAYTLYSDGSIEATLPQGTLRFGSITELRNHIEQNA